MGAEELGSPLHPHHQNTQGPGHSIHPPLLQLLRPGCTESRGRALSLQRPIFLEAHLVRGIKPQMRCEQVQCFCTHFHFPPRTRTEERPWGAPSRRPQQLRACVVVPWGCWRRFGVGTGWARDLLCPAGALGVPSTPGSKRRSQTVIIPMGDPAAGAGMGEHPFASPFSPLFSCRSRKPSRGSAPSTWAAWPSPRPYFIWGGDGGGDLRRAAP